MIRIYAGLPGSGKTYLSESDHRSMPGSILFDDFLGAHRTLSRHGLFGFLKVVGQADVIANDVFLVDRSVFDVFHRTLIAHLASEIEWVFFEANPDVCLENIRKNRDGKRLQDGIEIIERLRGDYWIPSFARTLPVNRW